MSSHKKTGYRWFSIQWRDHAGMSSPFGPLHKLLSLLANIKGHSFHSLFLFFRLASILPILSYDTRKQQNYSDMVFWVPAIVAGPCRVGVTRGGIFLLLITFKMGRGKKTCQNRNRQRGQGPLCTIKCRDLRGEIRGHMFNVAHKENHFVNRNLDMSHSKLFPVFVLLIAKQTKLIMTFQLLEQALFRYVTIVNHRIGFLTVQKLF